MSGHVVVVAVRLADALGYAYRLPRGGRVSAMSEGRANRKGLCGLGDGDTVHVLNGATIHPAIVTPLKVSGVAIKAVRR